MGGVDPDCILQITHTYTTHVYNYATGDEGSHTSMIFYRLLGTCPHFHSTITHVRCDSTKRTLYTNVPVRRHSHVWVCVCVCPIFDGLSDISQNPDGGLI